MTPQPDSSHTHRESWILITVFTLIDILMNTCYIYCQKYRWDRRLDYRCLPQWPRGGAPPPPGRRSSSPACFPTRPGASPGSWTAWGSWWSVAAQTAAPSEPPPCRCSQLDLMSMNSVSLICFYFCFSSFLEKPFKKRMFVQSLFVKGEKVY